MIKRLVAIGGGNWQQKETKHIDQKIIEMSEKPQPRVLFFPTALKDDQGYAKRFKQYYRLLRCHVDAIRLLHSKKTYEQLEKEWLDYDILYLGGGDTKLLMDTLVSTHTDQIIRKAYEAGIIIAGYSAGANDLFHFGYAKQDEQYTFVEGMKLYDGVFSPHVQERKDYWEKAKCLHSKVIGCEDKQAYILEDEKGYYMY